ncbi:MAG: hypothetical protein ACYCTL_02455 [Acidimicrobiales bacterium]
MPRPLGDLLPRLLGALALVIVGAVHLDLWLTGYSYIPSIGPLFMANVVISWLLAVALVMARRSLPVTTAVMMGSAVFAGGTFAAYLASITVGLLGFHESASRTAAAVAGAAEVGMVVVAAWWLLSNARHSRNG